MSERCTRHLRLAECPETQRLHLSTNSKASTEAAYLAGFPLVASYTVDGETLRLLTGSYALRVQRNTKDRILRSHQVAHEFEIARFKYAQRQRHVGHQH